MWSNSQFQLTHNLICRELNNPSNYLQTPDVFLETCSQHCSIVVHFQLHLYNELANNRHCIVPQAIVFLLQSSLPANCNSRTPETLPVSTTITVLFPFRVTSRKNSHDSNNFLASFHIHPRQSQNQKPCNAQKRNQLKLL